jgi:hypothetical protein
MGDSAIYIQDFTRGLPSVLPDASSLFGLSWGAVGYWIAVFLLLGGISYLLYSGLNRQVAGTLFFVIGFLMSYFYYVKWFMFGKKKRLDRATPCPDYLTQYIKPASADGSVKAQTVCLDFVGVSSNGSLKKCVKTPAECMADPTNYVFTPPTGAAAKSLSSYQDLAAQYGLLWTSVLGDV